MKRPVANCCDGYYLLPHVCFCDTLAAGSASGFWEMGMRRPLRDNQSRAALDELCSIVIAIEELFEDAKSERRLVYAPDYSLFSPVAWPTRTSGTLATDKPVSENLDYIGARFFQGFEQVANNAKFDLVMLPPTFLELQKSLLDAASAYDSVADSQSLSEDLFKKLEQFADGRTDQMPTRAVSMADSLSINISSVPDGTSVSGLDYLVSLFKSGVIKGVSDFVQNSDLVRLRPRLHNMSEVLRKDLNDVRNKRKNEEEDDFEFRNWADATNIGFSYAVYSDATIPFIPYLGPAPRVVSGDNYVDLQDTSMRNPLSPFLMVSAMLNSAQMNWQSGTDYLEVLLDRIKPLVGYLSQSNPLSMLSEHKHDAILSFYNNDMVNLFDHRERREELRKRALARAGSLLENRDSFRDRFSSAAKDLREKGEEMLQAQPGMLADELVDFYNMRKSPKAKSILAKYGVS